MIEGFTPAGLKRQYNRSPLSCTLGGTAMLAGLGVLIAWVYSLFAGDPVLGWKGAVGSSFALMVGGAVLWSQLGTVIDLGLGIAEQKAEEGAES